MLINVSISNLFSIKETQNLSMLAVSSEKDNINPINTFQVAEQSYLKTAFLYGANASGKSNIFKAVNILKEAVLESVKNIQSNTLTKFIPFLLDPGMAGKPSEVEISFLKDKVKYRYGLSILNGLISEEWLYYTPSSRETILFERSGDEVSYNLSGFPEASKFVDKETKKIQKTRSNVPFISVLSSFDGQVSKIITNWFLDLNVISGVQDEGFKMYTWNMFEKDEKFKEWACGILKNFQIESVNIDEVDISAAFGNLNSNDEVLQGIISSIKNATPDAKSFRMTVVKKHENLTVEFPVEFESDGTKKVINMLGPLYDSIMNGRVLFIDEFDSKFHTLLSKFILREFHRESHQQSQIVCSVQDTNLMDTTLLRRDQIWFIDKDRNGESNLYSLVEFKERNRALRKNYGEDYLEGNFDAIPLFENSFVISELME